MLRMWPISEATLHAVGHVHGSPIPIRTIPNENANYDSFRTAPKRSTLSAPSDARAGSISSMTPPSPVTRNLIGSLGSSKRGSVHSRYKGDGSTSEGNSLGTSPLSDPDAFSSSKSADEQASSGPTRNNKAAGFAVTKTALAPQYLTGRPALGRHKNAASAMAWMEGVQREGNDEKAPHMISQTPTSADFAPDQRAARLQEEFAQVSRKFSGKVMFERSA